MKTAMNHLSGHDALPTFYTDTHEWKRRIVEQGRDAALQAVSGAARNASLAQR